MISKPLLPPTMALLRDVLPQYGARFDRSLEAARRDIGDEPDLADPVHAARLRIWLNQWTCRMAYPKAGEADVFARSLARWWTDAKETMPAERQRLAELTDGQLQAVSHAYAELYQRPAAINRVGTTRSVGSTAAAKLLYFVRPLAVTAWDKAISARTGKGNGEAAFLRHLTSCRNWARGLEAEAGSLGLNPSEIGPSLGRPASSVAKLIDEWLYATVTGGLGPVRAEGEAIG